jgi:hypothetical protein
MIGTEFWGARTIYVAGFVIPVPEDKIEAYRQWAANSAALFAEDGGIEIVESCEDNVPPAKPPTSAAPLPQDREHRFLSQAPDPKLLQADPPPRARVKRVIPPTTIAAQNGSRRRTSSRPVIEVAHDTRSASGRTCPRDRSGAARVWRLKRTGSLCSSPAQLEA